MVIGIEFDTKTFFINFIIEENKSIFQNAEKPFYFYLYMKLQKFNMVLL